jgi:hypothetical protein
MPQKKTAANAAPKKRSRAMTDEQNQQSQDEQKIQADEEKLKADEAALAADKTAATQADKPTGGIAGTPAATTLPGEPVTESGQKILAPGVPTADPQAFVHDKLPVNREFLGPRGEYLTADQLAQKKAAAAQQPSPATPLNQQAENTGKE